MFPYMSRAVCLATVLITFFGLSAPGQSLKKRILLGNATSDLAYLPDPPRNNRIAILDDYAVYGLPAGTSSGAAVSKLFDLDPRQWTGFPNGMTYLPDVKRLVLTDAGLGISVAGKLLLYDLSGKQTATVTLDYSSCVPAPCKVSWHTEALAYVPPNSGDSLADRILMVSMENILVEAPQTRIDVIRRDWKVERQIWLDPADAFFFSQRYIAGLEWTGPNRLVVSGDDDAAPWAGFEIDAATGNVLRKFTVPGTEWPEGILQLPGGKMITAGGTEGVLRFYDAGMTRLPGQDLTYQFRPGVTPQQWISWSGDSRELLVRSINYFPGDGPYHLMAIDHNFNSSRRVLSFSPYGSDQTGAPRRLDAMDVEQKIVVPHRRNGTNPLNPNYQPRRLMVYNLDGSVDRKIDLTSSASANPDLVRFLPWSRQFAVVFSTDDGPTRRPRHVINLLDWDGAAVAEKSFGLTSNDSIVFFTAWQDKKTSAINYLVGALLSTGKYSLLQANGDGTVLRTWSMAEFMTNLGLTSGRITDVDYIAAGPGEGDFVALTQMHAITFRLQ